MGLGAEAAFGLGNHVAFRGGIGTFPFTVTSEFDKIEYTIDPPSQVANVGLDFYPSADGAFRLSVGAMMRSEVALEGRLTGAVEVGGQTYPADQVGSLSGTVENNEIAPYATLGFGRTYASGVGFFMEIGAGVVGEPTLTLTASGPISGNAQFQDSLERERAETEEDLGTYLKFHPIVSFGISFGFGS
jgi:hypothetical protein